ncbi:thymidylate synthase [Saccharothrix variisporea]|uniref:thymidylate synthase n=1 Tax=Saccharothrix variisporea TaxID=543527 RepID=A0A495XIW0_9PSEU|nr:thymidylate synthase [Saccharothrix variisporea]RKT72433.1 thymidylate synthase [Saccharothrix variisporea]
MFKNVTGRTADDAWRLAYAAVRSTTSAQVNPTRGNSRELHHVTVSISDPRQRWVVSRNPPLNPAFALAEVVWILQGRSDLAFLEAWNGRLSAFTGNSPQLHGAYGARLRAKYGIDQLQRTFLALRAKPFNRQAVLQIWSAIDDLPGEDGLPRDTDIPCNVVSMLKVLDDKLEWLQVMRSNDVILGLPYNLVQWTTLQEIFAGWLGLQVGTYNHVSDSLHLYERDMASFTAAALQPAINNDDLALPYEESQHVLAATEAAIEAIARLDSPAALESTITDSHVPQAYLNWLWVMACERLRRNRDYQGAKTFATRLTNPALIQAWGLWSARQGGVHR